MEQYHQDERYLKAMELYLAGQWNEAAGAFDEVVKAYPGQAFLRLLQGNISYSQGKLDTAVEQYQGAVDANPDFGNAYYKLGVCLYRMGHLKRALEAFTRVVDLKDQSHAMASYFVGLIHFFLGEDEAASEAFASFHALSPESMIANFYLAQLKVKHKQFQEALELLQALVEVTPDFAEVHYMLGTVHYGLHNNTEAIQCFRRALELNPADERTKTKLTLLTDVQWP